jgi:hypothetical protein
MTTTTKTAFKVTLPDGTVDTRTSAKAYTHVAVCAPTREQRLTSKRKELAMHQRCHATCSEQSKAFYAERIARNEAEITAIETGPERTYTVWQWSSREDLATKAARGFEKKTGFTFIVQPVD